MNNLYNLLLKIRKDPQHFLERPTLKYLHAFMSGYVVCKNYIDSEAHYDFYPGFHNYVQDKYHISLTLRDMDIIEFHCNSEEEAFERYFILLDEYISLLSPE